VGALEKEIYLRKHFTLNGDCLTDLSVSAQVTLAKRCEMRGQGLVAYPLQPLQTETPEPSGVGCDLTPNFNFDILLNITTIEKSKAT